MSPGLTTERIYAVLKGQIMAGERRPGERLDPARLATDLNASATPVRDALHQLLGERMVEAWPSLGFQVPVPSESALRDLYGWHSDLMGLLLRGWKPDERPRALDPMPASGDPVDVARALFEAIAARLGSGEHRLAVRQAGDRLCRARKAEVMVFADHAAEYEAVLDPWLAGQPSALRAALARYHRRRQNQVAAIVASLLAGGK